MLHNWDTYRADIENALAARGDELEWRFRSQEPPDYLEYASWEHSEYTVDYYPGDRRVRGDTKKQEIKKRVAEVVMEYRPTRLRLVAASEQPAHGVMLAGVQPELTRHISRWSSEPRKTDGATVTVSEVDGSWEVELEFDPKRLPATADAAIAAVEIILPPGRLNMVTDRDIRWFTGAYNHTWAARPMRGYVRQVGYKPIQVDRKDLPYIATRLVSNKLDGTKYTLITGQSGSMAVNETDAMWIADIRGDGTAYDAEYYCGRFHVWDMQTQDATEYTERHRRCEAFTKGATLVETKPLFATVKAAVAWMRRRWGKKWRDANDGFIFTSATDVYTASRPLKWKWPDRISVDALLRTDADGYRTYAYGEHQPEVEVPETHLHDVEPGWNGKVAELGRRPDGSYYIMRARPDKTRGNFIRVYQETLAEMADPISLEEITRASASGQIRSGGECDDSDLAGNEPSGCDIYGGAADAGNLLPDLPADVFDRAAEYIAQDRDYFVPIRRACLEFAARHNLRVGAAATEAGSMVVVYSANPLRTSNDLANRLFELNNSVFMKTTIPYMEFDISVLSRMAVRIIGYPRVFGVHCDRVYPTRRVNVDGVDVDAVGEPIELIPVYHQLYMPFPERWEEALDQCARLTGHAGGRRGHHGKRNHQNAPHDDKHNDYKPHRNEDADFAGTVRAAVHAALATNDIGILVGPWALYEYDSEMQPPRADKITLLAEGDISERLATIVRAATDAALINRASDIPVPGDMFLHGRTYYVEHRDRRIAIADVYNSLDYELVPWTLGARTRCHVGNPWVVCRFFMIDSFLVSVLGAAGKLDANAVRQKSARIASAVRRMHAEAAQSAFGSDYSGVYKDLVIERRRVIKMEEKFQPYRPYEYHTRYGKVRTIQ